MSYNTHIFEKRAKIFNFIILNSPTYSELTSFCTQHHLDLKEIGMSNFSDSDSDSDSDLDLDLDLDSESAFIDIQKSPKNKTQEEEDLDSLLDSAYLDFEAQKAEQAKRDKISISVLPEKSFLVPKKPVEKIQKDDDLKEISRAFLGKRRG